MKIAFIGSVADIREVHALGSIDMALTHLFLESKPYADYFRSLDLYHPGREWILDNSIMELGDSLASDNILAVAAEFFPSIIVAPDSFNNKKETISRTTDFLRLKYKRENLRYAKSMAVAHGKNWDDWKDCCISHQQNGNIDMIGLPYGTTFEIPGCAYRDPKSKTLVMMDNRLQMTSWIAKNIRKPKPCHLLGASDPRELFWQKHHDFIYSHDSSSAYTTGLNGHALFPDRSLGREKFKMDFKSIATRAQLDRIKQNAAVISSWSK